MKKKDKLFCPYCGSKKITLCKPPSGSLIDPAPTIITLIGAFNKQYKCEDCGKEFN